MNKDNVIQYTALISLSHLKGYIETVNTPDRYATATKMVVGFNKKYGTLPHFRIYDTELQMALQLARLNVNYNYVPAVEMRQYLS